MNIRLARSTERDGATSIRDGGMSTGVAVIGFLLCGLAGAGLTWGYEHRGGAARAVADGRASAPSSGPWSDDESPVPVSSVDPTWGRRDAPVTIVQFSDFECPYCGRVEAAIARVKQTYGPEKVRIVWKNEPLGMHAHAQSAAEAGAAVFALGGNDAFWKWSELAFKNQASLGAESYGAWARQVGIDPARASGVGGVNGKSGTAAQAAKAKVAKDNELAQRLSVNALPAFFVNGVSITGAQPFEAFKTTVDQELQKANAKIAAGTPKDHVYVAMSRENFKAAPAQAAAGGDPPEDTTTVWKVPIGKSPVRGPEDAPVTIVAFSDFQCPYCKKAEETLEQIREAYGPKVRVVWKNEPLSFHAQAEPAAQLALEARAEKGDKGFWDVHDKLFASAPKLDAKDLESVAASAGLQVEKAKAAIGSHAFKRELDADADVVEDFQAYGTPYFFINGRRLVGIRPLDQMKPMLDEEVKRGEALLAKGTRGPALYDALVAQGKEPAPPEKKTVALPTNGPTKGNPDAKVTILEVSDFQCPFCKRGEDTLITEVMKSYGDRVKVTWRHLPLPMHPDAPLAAEAAQEAFAQKGSTAFWKMHDLLFQNQGTPNGLKREALDAYAAQIGLDAAKFKASLDQRARKPEVDADAKVATDAGLSAAPAFLINGYYISGAVPYPKFRKVLERALAETKR